MPTFQVRFAHGVSAVSKNQEQFMETRHLLMVDAESRTEAYHKVFEQFNQQGDDVTVIPYVDEKDTFIDADVTR